MAEINWSDWDAMHVADGTFIPGTQVEVIRPVAASFGACSFIRFRRHAVADPQWLDGRNGSDDDRDSPGSGHW